MTRNEVIEQIARQRKAGDCFVKTWEAGHTFVDFDLIERFIAKSGKDAAIEGFELLDLEQMWQVLTDLDPDKLLRVKSGEGEVIEWDWKKSDGADRKCFYPFSPEGIMKIIDDEFFA
jgi:hypothetical protein